MCGPVAAPANACSFIEPDGHGEGVNRPYGSVILLLWEGHFFPTNHTRPSMEPHGHGEIGGPVRNVAGGTVEVSPCVDSATRATETAFP